MNPQDEQIVSDTGKSLTKFTEQHAHEVGLPSPQAVNFMFSIANMLYSSALVTKDMGLSKDQVARLREFGITGEQLEIRDREAVRSNAIAKMLVGRELGIEPMAALQDVDIVKAKVFIRYPQLHRLIEEKGYTVNEIERSHDRAAILLTHPTRPERTFEFTLDDAKRAGLTKRGGYNGDSPSQYELRPRVMLWARVISESYRATGGKGSVYALEEKQEIMAETEGEWNVVARDPKPNPYVIGIKPKDATPETGGTVEPSAAGTSSGPGTQPDAGSPPTGKVSDAPPSVPPNAAAASDPVASEVVTGTGEPTSASAGSPKSPILEMPKRAADPNSFGAILDDLKALIPGDDKERAKTIENFLRGFLNVTKVPKNDPRIVPAMRLLREIARSKKQLLVDAKQAGLLSGVGWRAVEDYIASWPDVLKKLAREIAALRYAPTPDDLVEYLKTDIKIESFSPPDQLAFLQVFARIKGAVMLLDMAAATGRGMAEIVGEWGKDVDAMTEAEILAQLEPQDDESAPADDLFEGLMEDEPSSQA